MTEKKLLRPREACPLVGVSEERLRQWLRSGLLKSLKDGNRYFIPRTAIDELIAKIASGELRQV